MRAVVCADLHLCPKRLETCLSVLEHLKSATSNDFIIFLGDTFDSPRNLSVLSTSPAMSHFDSIIEKNVMTFFVRGNHECPGIGDESAIDIFVGRNKCRIIKRFHIENILGRPACFLPFSRSAVQSSSDAAKARKFAQENNGAILFAHVEIPFLAPYSSMEDVCNVDSFLCEEDLDHFGLVVLGHYHNPFVHRHILGVGSPYETDFGSVHADRGFQIISMENGIEINKAVVDAPKFMTYIVGNVGEIEALSINPHNRNRIVCCSEEVYEHAKDRWMGIAQVERNFTLNVKNEKRLGLQNLWSIRNKQELLNKYIAAVPTSLDAELMAQIGSNFINSKSCNCGHKVEIKSVTMKDFLSFCNDKISFENENAPVLILGCNQDGGSNGAGKSSIFEAIFWALTGTTLRGVSGNAVTRNGSKKCTVTLELLYNGSSIEIVRSLVAGTMSLSVQKDKFNVTASSVRETQKIIDEMGLDAHTLRHLMFFLQQGNNFFAAKTDKEQKECLESLIAIDFSEELDSVRSEILFVEKDLQAEERSLYGKKERIPVIEDHIQTIENFDKLLSDKDARMVTLNKMLCEFHCKLEAIAEKHIVMSDQCIKIEKAREKLEEEISNITARIIETASEINLCREKINDAVCRKKDAEVQMEFANSRKKCPLCQTAIKTKSAICKSLQTKIDEECLILETAEANIDILTRQTAKLERIVKGKGTLKSDVERQRQDILSGIHILDSEERAIQQKESGIQAEISSLTADLKDAPRIKEDLKGASRDLEVLRQEIDSLQASISANKVYLEYLHYLEKAFGLAGIRSFILDLVIPILNELASKILKQIGIGRLQIIFDNKTVLKSGEERERFVVKIITDIEQPYLSYSGGERTCIDLAIMFTLIALGEPVIKINLAVFDEVLHLDDANSKILYGFLRTYARESQRSIYVISHSSDFMNEFENVWTVQKRDGVSMLLKEEVPF